MNRVHDRMRRVLALPPDERREALIPLYRAAYGAYGRDWSRNTAACAEDYEFWLRGANRMPGLELPVRGRDGYIRMQSEILEFLQVDTVELDDLMVLEDGRVVAFTRFVVRAGGGTIDQQILDVHEFRDGELIRQTVWFDRAEGLRELGLAN